MLIIVRGQNVSYENFAKNTKSATQNGNHMAKIGNLVGKHEFSSFHVQIWKFCVKPAEHLQVDVISFSIVLTSPILLAWRRAEDVQNFGRINILEQCLGMQGLPYMDQIPSPTPANVTDPDSAPAPPAPVQYGLRCANSSSQR